MVLKRDKITVCDNHDKRVITARFCKTCWLDGSGSLQGDRFHVAVNVVKEKVFFLKKMFSFLLFLSREYGKNGVFFR